MFSTRHWPLLFVLVAVIGCSKNGTGPGQGTGPVSSTALVGTWELEKSVDELYLTVNKEQTIYDPEKPGQGGIVVSGAKAVTLTYLEVTVNSINVSDIPLTTENPVYPYYVLSLGLYGGSAAVLTVHSDSTGRTQYIGTNAQYDFDTTNYQLTLDRVVLHNRMQRDSVTVTGTLRPQVTTIPANTQTQLTDTTDARVGKHTYLLNINSEFEYSEGTDTTAGTWQLSGTTITLVTVIADTPANLTDTSVYTQVSISGDVLTWLAEEDYCGQSGMATGVCYTSLEMKYGLEAGSLEQAVIRREYVYNRIGNNI